MSGDAGAILAAAGAGKRFGAKKQFLQLAGRPLIHYSLDLLGGLEEVSRIVVVLPSSQMDAGRRTLERWLRSAAGSPAARRVERGELGVDLIEGGARRQDSVRNGLRHLEGSVRFVLVHDAARPLLRADDARRVLDAIREHGAAVLGTPVTDSVKRVKDGTIVETLSRDEIWTVQTPQGAVLDLLLDAYESDPRREFTDEAAALHSKGIPVVVVEGPPENLKITKPGDEVLAEFILGRRAGRRRATSRE